MGCLCGKFICTCCCNCWNAPQENQSLDHIHYVTTAPRSSKKASKSRKTYTAGMDFEIPVAGFGVPERTSLDIDCDRKYGTARGHKTSSYYDSEPVNL